MTSQRPLWLLDVDGVLNAVHDKPDRSVWPADQWMSFDAEDTRDGLSWPMLIARPVVDFLTDIHRRGLAEIRWHTTWQREAWAIADHVGLPRFEVQDAPEFDSCEGWWKLPAAHREIYDSGRTVVWTDDDLAFDLSPQERRELGRRGAKLVIPQQRLGLIKRHLREIGEFLDA